MSYTRNILCLLLIGTFSTYSAAQVVVVDRHPGPAKPRIVNKKYAPTPARQTYYRHSYYPIGHKVKVLPSGYFSISVGKRPYYYHSGVYYRKSGFNYVVTTAPVGAYIHTLPYGYRTVYFGSTPYYYANNTYYLWDDVHRAYTVTERPDTNYLPQPEQVATSEAYDIFVYPSQGQSTQQTSVDRYECYLWAVDQTGFDPSTGHTGNSGAYQRALQACLQGRGYTVK